MFMRFIYVYAFDGEHNLVEWKFLKDEDITIRSIKSTARWMMTHSKEIKTIVAVDQSRDLKSAFKDLLRDKGFTGRYEFYDWVKTEGIVIVDR